MAISVGRVRQLVLHNVGLRSVVLSRTLSAEIVNPCGGTSKMWRQRKDNTSTFQIQCAETKIFGL